MLQHVVGHSHERILLAEHRSVLTDKGKTIHIRVNHETDVVTALAQQIADFAEMLFQRFGIMGKVAGGFGIQRSYGGHSQLSEQFGKNHATHGIDSINRHGEMRAPDGFDIHQLQFFHKFYMTLVIAEILGIATQTVNIGKFEIAVVGQAHHLGSLCGRQELATLVQEFQSVPLTGIMAGRDDDTAASLLHRNGKFGGRRGGKTDIDDIESHAHQRSANHMADHLSGDTGIAAYNDLTTEGTAHYFFAQTGICRHRFGDVNRIQGVSGTATDSAAET